MGRGKDPKNTDMLMPLDKILVPLGSWDALLTIPVSKNVIFLKEQSLARVV